MACESWFCEDDCEGQEARPIQGAQVDFTIGTNSIRGVVIDGPQKCTQIVQGHRIEITGLGAELVTPGESSKEETHGDLGAENSAIDYQQWTQELFDTINKQKLRVHSSGFGLACSSTEGAMFWLATDEWGDTDALAEAIAEALVKHNLGNNVELQVTQEPLLCAQKACGW